MTIEDTLFSKKEYIDIYLRNKNIPQIHVLADSVDKIVIEEGFLKLHDCVDNGWHCYNLSDIDSYHYPGHRRIVNN